MEDVKYVPLPSPRQQQDKPLAEQQQQMPGSAAQLAAAGLNIITSAEGGGGGGGVARTSSGTGMAAVNSRLQAALGGRRPTAAAAVAAAAGASISAAGMLPDAKAQRSRSAGKVPGRPLADGKAAPPRSNFLLPSQMPAQLRQRDKLVLLPRSASEQHEADAAIAHADRQQQQQQQVTGDAVSLSDSGDLLAEQQQPASSLFLDLAEVLPDSRGRVTVFCIAESLNRDQLEVLAAAAVPGATLTLSAEVLHMSLPVPQGSEPADCFFFDYGVVCCWGLTAKQEQDILNSVAKKAQEQPLPPREIEVDRFEYNYSTAAPPSMQNDTITISRHHAHDPAVKLAICHALAQSTKLCIHEERVLELVLETKHLPQTLAQKGTVSVTAEEVAQRIGQVFIQRAAVNLLGSVLDTPEWFWTQPDQLQSLYERACDYLELDRRVEVLNARFTVLQGMLNMLRAHIATTHSVRIEVIIIWLIAVELVVGCVELLGLFGWF